MPNSLRVKLSKLRYKGEITQEEYDELTKKLNGHDSELLDKVAERIKIRLINNLGLKDATKYGNKNAKQQANSYATVMKYEIADIVDDLLDDLEEMKADVTENDRRRSESISR